MEKDVMIESLVNHYTDGNKAQFAKMVGISPQTLSKWIGRKTFDAEAIYKHCKNVSAEWLLSGGQGEMLRDTQRTYSDVANVELIKLRAENDILRELVNLRKKSDAQVGNVG